LEDLEKQRDVEGYIAKVPELLPAMENTLRRSLKGPMSEEAYAEASSPFFEMGYHATGAVLLAAIEKKRGLPSHECDGRSASAADCLQRLR
jgi:hypothetical protein